MTRKQYTKKLWTLAFAIRQEVMENIEKGYAEPIKYPMSYKAMADNAKDVAKKFGSYENAWNADHMKWARAHYLGEEVPR